MALDARDGKIAVEGWQEQSGQDLVELAQEVDGWNIGAILFTNIHKDGTREGPDVEGTAGLQSQVDPDRHRLRRHWLTRRPSGAFGGGDSLSRVRAGTLFGRLRIVRSIRGARRGLMLAKRIIPCLDVKDGRVVKGVNFVGLRDAGDPVESAQRYSAGGADEITFLDITASHENRRTLFDLVDRTASTVAVPLTVGGGVRERRDVSELLHAGADKVSINSAAVANPTFIKDMAEAYGAQAIVVAIDAKRVPGETDRWTIYTHGGRRDTGLDAIAWAKRMADYGAGEILLTSMDRDGTQDGYDLVLTRAVVDAISIPVVASGVWGPSSTCTKVSRPEGRMRRLQLLSFTTATTLWPRSRSTYSTKGFVCARRSGD